MKACPNCKGNGRALYSYSNGDGAGSQMEACRVCSATGQVPSSFHQRDWLFWQMLYGLYFKRCPQCGHETASDANHCPNCATGLND